MNLTGHHSTRFFRIPLISLTCALLPMALFADLAAATPIISVTPDSLHQALMSGDTASQTLTISNTGATALDYQIDFQRIRGAGAAGGPSIPGRFSLSRELSSAGRFPIRAEDWTSYRESYGAFLSSESSTRVEAAPVSPEGWSGPAAASRVMRQIADSFVIFSDDMESGAGGWTHSSTHVNGIDQWTLQSNVASSGAWSWQVSQHSGVGADALKSPAIDLTGFADATLTFKHYYNFDDCSGDPTFEPDGGIVEVSTDGGGSWTQVFPVGGYPYTLDDICGNILAFFDAYSHDGGTRFAFEPAAFDLTPFAGQIIQIRFHAGWDCGNCGINDGWFIDDVTVKSADFVSWLSADIPSGTVPAGGSVDVSILFDAGGLLEADYPADILITSNDPAAPVVTVPTFLAVTGIPAMTLSASSFSFAPLFVGDSSIASLTVGNTGTAALNVSSIVSDNSSFLSDISAFSVAPGDTQIVLVTFKPTAAGSHSGALTITSDDPTSPVFPLTVSGIGLDPPIMSVAPDSLDEALLTGGATARTVTITNSGGSDLSWESMALKVSGGPTNAYTLTIPAVTSNSMESGDPGSSLPPANVRSTAISATLSDLSGVVIMSNNSVSSWSTIVSDLTLRGAVVLVNSDTLTPALLDSVDIFWTHDFPGWSPAELTALSNWVNAGGSLLFEGDESWSAYNQLLAAIGVNIAFASGGSTGITTNIFPHETTTGVARLNLVSNLGHLSNVSAPAGLLVSDISNQEHCAYSSAGVGRVVAVANEDFINAAIGSEDNQLFANQVFDWLASAVDWLTVTPDSGTVAPAASGALTATFDASGLIGGDYLAEIIITSNDPLAREISIPTHLNVTGAPDITVSDSALAFDSIFIGYNQVLSITITNSGTDVLTVGSVTIDNADFSVDASSFSLNPGQSQVATLTFAPSSAGNISGIMTINSDDPNQPALPIPLSGIGLVAPVIGVSPASLSDSLLTGEAALHTLTISNTGGSDLAFAVSVKNGTSPGSPSAPGARRDSPSVRFVSAAMRAELAESLEKLRREPTLNETSPTTLARQTMDVFYTGDHLSFGVSDYGEIMPFSHPAGISEHLAAGVWVSGYNLSYTISGSNRLAYSAYNARLSIIPVSLTQLVNDSSVAKVEVVTSTADGALIITRTFTFDKSDKYISITNSIENQSGSPITDLVFKSFADWDMRSSPSNDNWDYDLSRNMIYASDGVYAAIASARVPDLMDIAGWNDYRVRPTTVELPVGPVNSFDGLEVLHFELGSLATGAATDVKTVFAAGQDLADLQGAVDRGLVFADWVSVESPTQVVPAGGSVDLLVTFDATGLFGGAYTADISIVSNDSLSPEVLVPTFLHVTGAPDIDVSAAALEFDSLFIGSPQSDSIIITNIGTDVLNVGAVAMSNADFSVDVSSFSLTPGQSQVATVTFTPSSPGVINGTMTISSDDPDQPSLEVLLSGVGLIPPVIGVSPASLSDSLLTGDSSLHTLTISNTGGSDLVFDVSFKNSAGPALMPVPPEDFFDQNTAILSGALAPLPSTEDSPQIVTPSAGSPDSSILVIQDFSSWGVFMSSFIQSTFGLTPTVINSTQITSTDFSPFDLVITTGSQSTSYYTRISSSVGKFEDFVAAGGVVQYQAATQGPDVLIVDSARVINSNREDFNRVLLPTHPIVAGLPTILEGNFANHGILADLPVAASVITETSIGNSPTTVEYGFGLGTVVATGMTWEFLFDRGFNSGPMLVNALAYSLSLAGVGWVSVEPSAGVTVPAGGSIDLSVTFNATGLFGGAYTADISIVSNDSLSPEVLVPALLHVTGAPDLQTSDTSLDFGTVFIGVTRTDSFVVSNIGVEVLNVSGISSSSTDYTATPGLFSLAPGGTRLVEVSFAPTVEGAIPAALTISSDDPLEPTVIVALAGSGLLPPIISAAPDSLDADQLTDDITTQILTVSNGGSSDLIFDAVVLSAPGSPPAPYLLTPPDSSGDAPDYDGTAPDPLAPPYRTTPISATLFDLSGVVILSNGSLGSWTTIVSDLTLRGAVVHEFFGTLTPALLDTVDIYWTHDFSGWSPSELTALSGWVNAGGSVLFEADQSSSAYNQLLAAIGVNITFASGGSSGTTSNIFPHETTLGVASLALNSNLGHLSNVSAPAGLLVSDVSGQPHGAYSAAGFGRVIALANEDFVNSSIGIVDNQLFANQVFDWLAQALGWLSVSPESDTIPAGLSTDLTVTFDATGLFGGDYNARIALNSNDPFTPQLSVPAHMFVTGIPKIDVTPVSFDFGPLFIGLSLTDQFVVTNTGTDLLTVSSIVSDNTEFAADASSFTLNPTEDTVIGVTYTPTTAGIVNASLTITSDAANLPVALVTMTAEGVIPPDISVVPASISDTLISNSTSTHLLNIFNDGGSDLIFEAGARALTPVPPGGFFDPNTSNLVGTLPPLTGMQDGAQSVTPSAGNPDSNILVIQDASSWGVVMSTFIQSTFGLTPTVINSIQIATTDFSPFDIVITTGSQSTSYYSRVSSNVGKFEAFVAAGGVVQYQAATQGPDVLIVDNARVIGANREDLNRALLPSHPIVAGLPTILEGNFANHGILVDLPVGASVITETFNGNSPTTVEYQFGLGTVIATGMTWEFLFDRGFNSGPMLVNALAYSLSLAGTGWVSVEPTSGVIPAGDSQTVTVTLNDSSLVGCDFAASVDIASNDPDESIVSVPVDLHIDVPPVCIVPNDTLIFLCDPGLVCMNLFGEDSCDAGVTCEIVAGVGEIIGDAWCYTPTVSGPQVVTVRCTDAGGQFCESSFTVDFVLNQAPVCNVPADTAIFLCESIEVSLPVSASDVDGNLMSCQIVGGPGLLVGDQWRYVPGIDHTVTVKIMCLDSCGFRCQSQFTVDFDVNEPPELTCPPDTVMQYNQVLILPTVVVDPELTTQPLEALTYSLGPGSPDFASVQPATGVVSLTPQAKDICSHTVSVIATDLCGAADTCAFNVCVQNTPPVALCSESLNRICWGTTASGVVGATDIDNGPVSPTFSLVSFSGPGTPTIDPASGAYTWQTEEDSTYIGVFEMCVAVTDGANICDPCSPNNTDTCCLQILVVPTYRVSLETAEDVTQGGPHDLRVTLDDGYEVYPMAGYDFLIDYDQSALAITGASPGGFLTGNNWEFFSYRFGPSGNCGAGCPDGLFRVVALARANGGQGAPTGFTNRSAGSEELAILHFQISNNRTLGCQFAPVKWAWYDCGDNAIASVSGDTLFISRFVYEVTVPDTGALIVTEFGDGGANSIHGTDQDFPTFTGAPLMCEVSGGPNKPEPVRKIDLRNGGVKIICPDSIDSRGDINLNGLANEIADAVTFTGYFTIGLDAFRVNVEGQTAATEINGDGTPLTVADLVYLIRIIVGDALPLPKLQHLQFTAQVTDQGGTIATDRELGAALFVFDGVVDVALSQADLQLRTGVRQGNTYALVTPRIEPALIHSGAIQPGPVVEATGALLSVEIASYNGAMMHVATRTLPTTFSVMQNYPNPFNPRTIIAYDLPVEAQVTISIYNALGRQIRVFDEGDRPAGSYEVAWDGSDNNGYQVSSGLYFYKVVAGKFSASRKMILLK